MLEPTGTLREIVTSPPRGFGAPIQRGDVVEYQEISEVSRYAVVDTVDCRPDGMQARLNICCYGSPLKDGFRKGLSAAAVVNVWGPK